MLDFLKGKWLKHPLHPALVHIPTSVWPAAFIFDLFSQFTGGNIFVQLAFYAILIGLIVALLAIPTGYADWTEIKPDKPARKLGLYHMSINLVITVLWAVNWGLRLSMFRTVESVPPGLIFLSGLATAMLLVSGYLGGRMIYAYGISVARLSKEKWRKIAQEAGANVPPEEGSD